MKRFEEAKEKLDRLNYEQGRLMKDLGVSVYQGQTEYIEEQKKGIKEAREAFEEQLEKVFAIKKDSSLVPENAFYCYKKAHHKRGEPCPYWFIDAGAMTQDDGICLLTGERDEKIKSGFGLLWDQVKSCGINIETEIE